MPKWRNFTQVVKFKYPKRGEQGYQTITVPAGYRICYWRFTPEIARRTIESYGRNTNIAGESFIGSSDQEPRSEGTYIWSMTPFDD